MAAFNLVLILGLLIEMVKLTNLTVVLIIGLQKARDSSSNVLPAISTSMRLLTCAVIVIALVNQCERAYSERERILNIIDHFLVCKNPDEELRMSVIDLRALIRERPINFNMANFFTLNYSLLVSIASVVVTYSIILLQNMN